MGVFHECEGVVVVQSLRLAAGMAPLIAPAMAAAAVEARYSPPCNYGGHSGSERLIVGVATPRAPQLPTCVQPPRNLI